MQKEGRVPSCPTFMINGQNCGLLGPTRIKNTGFKIDNGRGQRCTEVQDQKLATSLVKTMLALCVLFVAKGSRSKM